MNNPISIATNNRHGTIKALFLILLITFPLFFFNLGGIGLTDRDEGSFSEATREMVETGDWLTPHFNYNNRFDKPVLIYYIMALSYRIFGINEFGARFHSAFFGTLLIFLVFFFVKSLKGVRTALLSSLILASNLAIVTLSRVAITDMVLVFLITAALFSFYRALWVNRKWSWGFYIFSALAFLIKGPVGVIVPILVIIAYLISLKGKIGLRGFHPFAGTFLFLLISAPWFLAMLLLHGSTYIEAARYHTLTRYSSVIGGHGGVILYYLPVVMVGFFPWSAFLPASIYYSLKENWKMRGGGGGPSMIIYMVFWIAVVFLFFTSSRTKLPHYIGPLFPPMAIMVADIFDRYLFGDAASGFISERWMKLSLGFLGFFGLIFSSALATSGILSYKIEDLIRKEIPSLTGFDLGSGPFLIAALFFAGTFSSIYFFIKGSKRMAIGVSVTMIVLIVISIMLTIVPEMDDLFLAPQRELAAFAGSQIKEGERFIVFGFFRPSLVFYSRQKVIFLGKENVEELRKELSNPGNVFVLCMESSKELLRGEKNLSIIKSRQGYLLLAKDING
ncbi:MAG: glycosyltransferase family 39 protein [Nitrospinae bacterium]|nr:glycosyltransferase family 39 protein [Nitrospinota bacterium]